MSKTYWVLHKYGEPLEYAALHPNERSARLTAESLDRLAGPKHTVIKVRIVPVGEEEE